MPVETPREARKRRGYHNTKDQLRQEGHESLSYRTSALYLSLRLAEWLQQQTAAVRQEASRQLGRGSKPHYKGLSTSIRCICLAALEAGVDLAEGWEVSHPEEVEGAVMGHLREEFAKMRRTDRQLQVQPEPGPAPTAQGQLVRLVTDFEGHPLTTLEVKGQPAWLAGEVARALGYAEPRHLSNKIAKDWNDDFVEGTDYLKVTGRDLAQLKGLVAATATSSESIDKRAASAIVLLESGLHTVLLRTELPAGKRLRRKLVEEILPQIARTGEYSPTREVRAGQVVQKNPEPEPGTTLIKARWEQRLEHQLQLRARHLELKQKELELRERELQHRAITQALEANPQLEPATRAFCLAEAAEMACGKPLPALQADLPRRGRGSK